LETEVFRKQMYSIEESTCDIFGTFQRPPQSFGAPITIWRPGNCALLLTPLYVISCFRSAHPFLTIRRRKWTPYANRQQSGWRHSYTANNLPVS